MTNYKGQPSTGEQASCNRNNPNRNEYFNMHIAKFFRDKNSKLNHDKNREHYGSMRYIEEGTNDRMAGNPYSPSMQALSNKDDKISYDYGYYEKGTRTIMVKIMSKQLTDEELYKIGFNDGQDENIKFEELPKEIQENSIYSSGFVCSMTEQRNMPKSR